MSGRAPTLAAGGIGFLAGMFLDRVIPPDPWALYLIVWAISLMAPLIFVQDIKRYNTRRNICFLAMAMILFIGIFIFSTRPEQFWLHCMSNAEAWAIISNGEGKSGDQGRKRAIECLVREGGSLQRVRLHGAWLVDLTAPAAIMPNAIMMGARLNRTDFRGADLGEALMSGAELSGVDFRGEPGRITKLDNAVLGKHEVVLRDGLNIVSRNYDGADLREAQLNEFTDVRGAFLIGVRNLTCAQLTKARNWETTFRDQSLNCGKAIPEWEGWE